MFKKYVSGLSIFTLLLMSATLAFGKPKGSWADVQNLVGQEVAVQIKNKKVFGVLKSADDKGIKLQTAGKKSLEQTETSFTREEIKKVWRALLFVNNRNTAKGALIGAAVGGGVLAGVAAGSVRGDRGRVALAGLIVGGIPGALAGGVTGFFWKKNHKKRDLVYKP